MEQEKEFKKLFQKLTSDYLERLPGLPDIVAQLIIMKLEERIVLLKILLRWLERYQEPFSIVSFKISDRPIVSPEIKAPFSVRYSITAHYRCQDCEKDTVLSSAFLMEDWNFSYDVGSDQTPHLVCSDCYYDSYDVPEYEPDSDYESVFDEEYDPSQLSPDHEEKDQER